MTTIAIRLRRLAGVSAVCACVGLSAALFAQVVQPTTPKPADPRVGLKPGMGNDAGHAEKGMQLVSTMPKAPAFLDADGSHGFDFFNSDLAFKGTLVIQGNFSGFSFFDMEDPRKPVLRTNVMCPGGQGDVSVWGHLLFMSVEETRGRVDCGVAPPPPPAPPAGAAGQPGQAAGQGRGGPAPDPMRFRGVRIFDITNMASPKQIAQVQTCRGSHTHTIVPDPKDKSVIYVYGQGTGGVRSTEELAGCVGDESDPNTALFSIDVIRVPLATPEKAAIVSRPRIFADPNSGAAAGLWQGGNHGEGTQQSGQTNRCHDITVYPALNLAAGACAGNGIVLDISDPVHPVRIDDVFDGNFAFWHSASFNNDGTKVLFTDEWGGGTAPRCRETDPKNWGGDVIYTFVNKRLKLASYYKVPAVQTELENCVAHNGSLVPVPGRDIKVQGWYQGGLSIVDFTDAAHPFEIAYFDRGPIADPNKPLDQQKLIVGGFWAGYWYNGYIYGSEIFRGLDVFKLVPTDQLTQNEIDAANLVHFDELNVQSQPKITWPASFVVAKAYLDQLTRSKGLAPDRVTALTTAMDNLEKMPAGAGRRTAAGELNTMADQLDKDAATMPKDAAKLRALATTIRGRTAQLR